MNSTKGAHEL